MNEELRMQNEELPVWSRGMRAFEHFHKCPSGGVTWLKNMKLRNEPILEMEESPDFTDVKWRF